jgi:hypothetical protein
MGRIIAAAGIVRDERKDKEEGRVERSGSVCQEC